MAQETWTTERFRRETGRVSDLKLPNQRFPKLEEATGRISFIIPGNPQSKPRMTQRDKWKQRPCVVKYRQWADRARDIAGPMPATEQIQRLDWVAYFEPPPSWNKAKRDKWLGKLHRQRPDRDNIDKAILDTLFKSDGGIASGTIEKRWGSPARLEITITVSP